MRHAMLGLLVLAAGCGGDWRFVDLWASRPQQGDWLMRRERYAEAAERFSDPLRKGVAFYRAGDDAASLEWFARVPGAEGFYNSGNAYARLGRYEEAVQAYDEALALRPAWREAVANRDLVAALLPPPPTEGDREAPSGPPTLPPDEVQFDDRGDKGERGEVDQSLFSEDQLAEMWMRGIRSSPADFLRRKFGQQAAERRR